MANEIDEFNRYWGESVGVFTYPKSGERRTGVFSQLTYVGPESVRESVPETAVAHFRMRTANGTWTSRTMNYSAFIKAFRFLPHKSRFVNVDKFAVYVHHSVKRQFCKGITESTLDGSVLLRDVHLDMKTLWLDKIPSGPTPPRWFDIAKEYFAPYPTGPEAIRMAFQGGKIGVAFHPHMAVQNVADVKYPVLYYRIHQAGLFERPNFLVLDVQYTELTRQLDRLLPGVGIKFHDFRRKADEYR